MSEVILTSFVSSLAGSMPPEILITKPCEGAKLRLVCFPHSGGGPSSSAWLQFQDVEVVTVSLPGHERRVDEQPPTDWKQVVQEVSAAVADKLVDDVPFALFGHSFGAILAFEVAHSLVALDPQRPRPIHLFVSASPGPTDFCERERSLSGLSDEELLKVVEQWGFLPQMDTSLVRAVVPALRADLTMWENYRPTSRTPLPVSISVIGGLDDTTVPRSKLELWCQD